MIYRHRETGNLYNVILAGEMKIEKGWVKAVIYMDLTGKIYVREKDNFYMKFEPVRE